MIIVLIVILANPNIYFCVYDRYWLLYGKYDAVMDFTGDVPAPWFRDADGKNIVCVLAVSIY